MQSHTAHPRPKALEPVNASLRFALELVALAAMGRWGLTLAVDASRYAWMMIVPLIAATLWGALTVPGDPSRGRAGPVHVSGWVRLVLETAFFAFATWALDRLGHRAWALVYAVTLCGHYAWTQERIRWLLAQHAR